jgi:hypothetical protein
MTTTNNTTCSCGCTKPHPIATRETADGHRLSVWSDGTLTRGRFGALVSGLGKPRSRYTAKRRAYAARLIMDEISAFDLAEIPVLVKAAEDTHKHTWANLDDTRRAAVRAASRA